MTSFSAGLRYAVHRIRNPMLYPTELRARSLIAGLSDRFGPNRRQRETGTKRKRAAQSVTLLAQSRSQSDNMEGRVV